MSGCNPTFVLALKCMYLIFIIYLFIIYLFLLSPKLIKLLKSCCLLRICLNIQLSDVFWASVKSRDTHKYLFYDFVLTLVFTCWTAFVAEVTYCTL
jgi:hypothetical protein